MHRTNIGNLNSKEGIQVFFSFALQYTFFLLLLKVVAKVYAPLLSEGIPFLSSVLTSLSS